MQSASRALPVPQNRPVATAPAAPAVIGASPYAAKNNQVISLAAANYSAAALAECGLKCTLAMTDNKGISFEVIFFKAQIEGLLKARAGKAAISGRLTVQGSRNILYLQSVR